MSNGTATIPDVPYEGKVRPNDPDTSWWAAGLIDQAGELILSRAVVAILREHGPLTHDAIAAEYHAAGGRRSGSRVRHIVKALVIEGDVKRADEKGRSADGNPSTRWELTK